MWLLSVTTVAFAVLADAGYLYNVPNVPFNAPNNRPANIHPAHYAQPHDAKIVHGVQDEDKSLSYSISYKDYIYLRNDNVENNNAHAHQLAPNYNNVQVHGNVDPAGSSKGEYVTLQSTQNPIREHSNNVYPNQQQWTPVVNYNNNYAQSYASPVNYVQHHQQQVVAPINTGYAQVAPISNSNVNSGHTHSQNLPASASYSNSYAQTLPTQVNQNSAYVQTVATDNNNYNSAYQQIAPNTVAANNVYVQPLITTGANNLNNGYVHTAETATYNNGYSQAYQPQRNEHLNNAYSQAAQANAPAPLINGNNQGITGSYTTGLSNEYAQDSLSSGYSQPGINLNNHYQNLAPAGGGTASSDNGYSHGAITSTSFDTGHGYVQASSTTTTLNSHDYPQHVATPGNSNLNNGYQNFAPSGGATAPSVATNIDTTNGYVQASSSTTSTQNSGYAQTSVSSENIGLNNGYHNLEPTGSANLNTGYEQTQISTSAIANTGFVSTLTPTVSSTSSASFSTVSSGPTHIDLNPIITQSSASAATTLGNGFTQSVASASDNLSNGLVQNNLNVVSSSVSAPSPQPVTPTVHKHIYFHVPPSEIEEEQKVLPPPPPPKKNYKIVFIKVPSQERQSNTVRLQQQIAEKQNSAVEDRTLIYVLVKNPEDPKPVILPKPKPSEHEVFFVKYNGSPFDIASQVNEEIDKTGSVKSIVPLEPGLVNGQHK